MKRWSLYLISALTLLSCAEKEILETVADTYLFEATREEYGHPGTKTVLRSDYSVDWLSGDNVGLFDGSQIERSDYSVADKLKEAGWTLAYRFKAATYGRTSKFSYNHYSKDPESIKEYEAPSAEGNYLLVYPWNTNFIASLATSEVRTWIDDDQTPSVGTYQANRGFAVAKTDDLSKAVLFRNAVTLLEFEIPAEMDGRIVKVAVKGNSKEVLAGDILIRYNDDGTVSTSSWDATYKSLEDKSAYTEVRFSKSSGAVLDSGLEAGRYYLVVMPQTLSSGLTVTATDVDGVTYVRKSSSAVELKVGTIYGMGKISAENYATGGVTGLPYIFSFYARSGSGNSLKYLTSADYTYDSSTRFSDRYYYDNKVSASLLVRCASTKEEMTNTDNKYWSNKDGNDYLVCKSFVTEESVAVSNTYSGDYPGETGYMFAVPLLTDLPQTFNLSFGWYATNGAIADWNVYVSKNGDDYELAASYVVKPNYHHHYTVTLSPSSRFLSGETLYLKFVPAGKRKASDTAASTHGWNANSGFSGALCIWETPQGTTASPSEAVYFEPFDGLVGGSDYLWGERIASMLNYCGDELSGNEGMDCVNVRQRHGYAQIGWVNSYQANDKFVNNPGTLTTPALNAEGTLLLEFKAMAYLTAAARRPDYRNTLLDAVNPDVRSVVVTVLNGGTIDGKESVTVEGLPADGFRTFRLVVKGAGPDTRIRFSSPSEALFSRWFIDDICVSRYNETTTELKFMSFNVSNSTDDNINWNDTDPKNWTVRRHAIKSMLSTEKPAVIGMQEATSVQFSEIAAFGYGSYGVGRATGGTDVDSGEMCPIFYDASQVTMSENKGTFWLNPKGTVGEIGWDAKYVRIASWAEFSVNLTGKRFIFLNTHLDNSGFEARKNSIRMILRKLDEINKDGLPVVISGDFNTMSDNFVFDPFIGRFDNAREVAAQTDNEATYTNWDGTGNKIIDHIFCCGFEVNRYRTVNERTYIGTGNFVIFDTDVPCPYLSDHDPITAILEL